ncbi:unnamed protein product, partial [Urochloa humidicola]
SSFIPPSSLYTYSILQLISFFLIFFSTSQSHLMSGALLSAGRGGGARTGQPTRRRRRCGEAPAMVGTAGSALEPAAPQRGRRGSRRRAERGIPGPGSGGARSAQPQRGQPAAGSAWAGGGAVCATPVWEGGGASSASQAWAGGDAASTVGEEQEGCGTDEGLSR